MTWAGHTPGIGANVFCFNQGAGSAPKNFFLGMVSVDISVFFPGKRVSGHFSFAVALLGVRRPFDTQQQRNSAVRPEALPVLMQK